MTPRATPRGGLPSDYLDVDGIMVASKHRILPRTTDGESLAETLIVSVDLSDIAFT
jgi:hypothetical protein